MTEVTEQGGGEVVDNGGGLTYLVKTYNGYSYGESGALAEITEELGYRHRMTKSANRDGAYTDASLHDPRRVSGSGTLTGAGGAQDIASLRAAWDKFKAAHQPGLPAPLFLDSDRFLNAQVEHLSFKFNGLYYMVDVSFLAYDPFWYSIVPTTLPLTQNAATTITPAGTTTSLPVFTLAVSAAPAGSLVTLANAQDTSLSFAPPAAGTFVIDCAEECVTDGNGVDQTAYLTGDFMQLAPGANSLTLTLSGGVTLSGQSVTWTDRWV